MDNGTPKPASADTLAGDKTQKTFDKRNFAVSSLDDVLREIRRAGGTGKLEINFRNGYARGDAKWRGYTREGS